MSLEDVRHTVELLRQLAYGETTPSKIVGTGYKDARKVALMYLADTLIAQLREKE